MTTTAVDHAWVASAKGALWLAAGFVATWATLRAVGPGAVPEVLLLSFGLLGGLSLAGAV